MFDAGFAALKLCGGAYLCWLGARTLADSSSLEGESEVSRPYVAGVTPNVLNPRVAVFFLAFLPQFVDGGATASVPVLGTTYAALTATYLGAVGATAGRARSLFEDHATALRVLSGAALLAFGLGVLADAAPTTFTPVAII